MTVKITVIYGVPKDTEEFERRYTAHKELVSRMTQVQRVEYGKVLPPENGSPPPRWRTADLYFPDYDTAVAALGTPEGRAAGSDATEIATGGVEFLFSDVEG